MFDSSDIHDSPIPRREPRVTVLPNRRRFEANLDRVLGKHMAGAAGCAVLYISVQNFSGTGVGRSRMLNLVGNALRNGMTRGEAAYLGDAEFVISFAVADDDEAARYARDMANVIANINLCWEGVLLSVSANIGCVIAQQGQDGAMILYQAILASELARDKPGCKAHIMRSSKNVQLQARDVVAYQPGTHVGN